MDLSNAFDTLNHDILLDELSYYGVEGTALQWFNSSLSKCFMYVEIDNINSSVRTLTTGVPQGSILGPLLFSDLHERFVQYHWNTHSQLIHQMLTSYLTMNWQMVDSQ